MGCFSCYGCWKDKNKKKEDDKEHGSRDRQAVKPSLIGKVQPDESNGAYVSDHTKSVAPLERTNDSSESGPRATEMLKDKIPHGLNIRAHTFTFRELASAAQNFREDCLIGEGGFGSVYKACLDDGQVVAIKKLNRNGLQGNREFLVEVLMLSLLQHENLVNLIGYCAEGDQRLLVYEYMPLGSLEDHLHDLPVGKEPLDWKTRMKIAAGAAKGLEHLHDIAKPPVIYRDLKSSNILLGDGFHPKLSDFGLAKLGPVGDKSHVSTRVMGTYGYCAPEYAMTGQLTMKSDVYSFGVVLLELITGRQAIDQTRPSGEHNLVAWARPLFKDRRKFAQMVDPNLQGHYPARGLFQALAVAAMCLHEQAASRPLIADVVTALNFLASQATDACSLTPNRTSSVAVSSPRPSSDAVGQQAAASRDAGGLQPLDNKDDGERQGIQSETEFPSWRAPASGKEREQAVAEARIWGEAWREKSVAT